MNHQAKASDAIGPEHGGGSRGPLPGGGGAGPPSTRVSGGHSPHKVADQAVPHRRRVAVAAAEAGERLRGTHEKPGSANLYKYETFSPFFFVTGSIFVGAGVALAAGAPPGVSS